MRVVEVFIDAGDQRGLAEQVYAQVRDAIVDGRLVADDVLTPSRTLAARLGISRFTVTEAYARLAAEGYVDGHRRGGTVVTGARVDAPPEPPRTAIAPRPLAASVTPYDAIDHPAGRSSRTRTRARRWRPARRPGTCLVSGRGRWPAP